LKTILKTILTLQSFALNMYSSINVGVSCRAWSIYSKAWLCWPR